VTASKAREVAVRAVTAIGRRSAVRHAANWAVGPLAGISPGGSDWLRHHVPVRGEVPVVSNVDGRPLRLWAGDDPDWLTVKLARNGLDIYEPETMRVFRALAAVSEVTIDVGAHIGTFSLTAARVNPDGQVVAFEPVPKIFDRLERNLELNEAHNVLAVNAAAGNRDDRALMVYASARIDSDSSQFASHRHAFRPGPWSCCVTPVLTIDEFVDWRGVQRVDLVKIDVEKAELNVLEGMTRVLKESRPDIICEVFPPEWAGPAAGEALQELLAPAGYTFYKLTENGPLRQEQIEGDHKNLNYLFTNRSESDLVRLLA
jgi:FkbM family methyltransferase